MEIMEAIRGRYTHRGLFLHKQIERDVLLDVLDAARWAPSGHNCQPWEFLVIDDRKQVEELIAESGRIFFEHQKTRRNVKKYVDIWSNWIRWSEEELKTKADGMYLSWVDRKAWEEMLPLESEDEIKASFAKIFADRPGLFAVPPAFIFSLLDTEVKIPNASPGLMHMTSMGAAIQNLKIAARGKGLETHEFSVLYDLPHTQAMAKELLNIPSQLKIVSVMKIGYPDSQDTSSKTHVRKPLEKIVHWNRF